MASIDTNIGAKPQGSTVPYRGSAVPSATDVQSAIDAISNYVGAADVFLHTANANLPAALVATDGTEITWDFSVPNAVKAALASNGVALSKIAQGSALSVVGVTGNATANHADIVGTADQVLRVNSAGTSMAFGTITNAGITNGVITTAKLASSAFSTDTALGGGTPSDTVISSQKAVKAYVDALATVVSGALIFKGSFDASSGSFPGGGTAQTGWFYKVSVAGTVNGEAFAIGDDIYAITNNASTSTYAGNWLRIQGDLTSAEIIAALSNASITYAKIQNVAGLSVFGRSANSSGVGADITGTDGQVLRVSGTALGFGTITYAGIQNVAGLSVFGRSANSSGVGADITGTDKQILRVSGTSLGFGTIDLSSTSAVANQLNAASVPALTGAVASAGGTLSTTSTIDLFVLIGDGINTISTGVAANWFTLDFAGTFVQWSVLANASGSISIDLWKCTYSQFDAGATHPVAGDKISASAPVTFSAATKGQSSTLTGWTTTFSAGDVLAFNVASVTTCKQVIICFKVTKTS
jgi:hypothetical protein